MKTDIISIVESAYDLEPNEQTWLRRLLDHAGPHLDQGFGVALSTYTPYMNADDLTFEVYGRPPPSEGSADVLSASKAMIASYPDIFHRVLSKGGGYQTATQVMGLTEKEAQTWIPYLEHLHPVGVRDTVGFLARDPTGHAIFFSAPQPHTRRPTSRSSSIWNRIAAHISAGARLRRALHGVSFGELANEAEAVLSPTGTISHAEPSAQKPDARESLRLAAKAIDRARSKMRSNEDEALDLWRALVAGRWSLVDQFDSDGRRFFVARKNEPDLADPRALTLRERQVLAYVAMGHSIKLIAYCLGVSSSSVSVTRRAAMRKVGLRSPADVVRLFAPAATADRA
ncbi:MAG: LuxR C-terminal-related transcriptional regulator [Polyangiaceae bacterium]